MLKIFSSSKQKQIFIIWETGFSKQNKNSWRKQLTINEKIKFSMEDIWWRVRKISWEKKRLQHTSQTEKLKNHDSYF